MYFVCCPVDLTSYSNEKTFDDFRHKTIYKKWNETKDNMAFSFNAKGFNIKGNVKLKEDKLILTGDLPWAARLFKGKIESTIKSKLEEMLN